MSSHKLSRLLAGLCVALLAVVAFAQPAETAITLTVDGNDPSCVTAPEETPGSANYCTIGDAISDALSGDTIYVVDGTYAEILSVTTDGLSIIGQSEAGTIIDATGATGYHFTVDANDVTIENLTLNGNPTLLPDGKPVASYGIKVSGLDINTQHTNFTIRNVTVNDTGRSGIDINGLNGVVVDNVTISGVPYGVGLAFSDVDNAVVNGVNTSNNAWGGTAIYTWGRYYPGGSDNITLSNINGTEPNPLYVEVGNYNDLPNPYPVTNLTLPVEYQHQVRNEAHRPNGANFTFYQKTEPEAMDFAFALQNPPSVVNTASEVQRLTDGHYIVGSGTIPDGGGGFISGELSIQAAVDAAAGGDTVEVRAGTYTEQVIVNKDLNILGDSGATLVAPATPAGFQFPESSATWEPILFAFGGTADGGGVITAGGTINVNVDGLTVDGNDRIPGDRSAGILFRSASGTISANTVQNMHVGDRQTFGIMVYGESDVIIQENNVSGYARGGIGVNGDIGPLPDPAAQILGNVVAGPGLGNPVTWAANGIQMGYGAEGIIQDNDVSGNGWPGPEWSGTGILIFASSNIYVAGNHVHSNESGIGIAGDNYFGTGTIADNTVIEFNTLDANTWAILPQDRSTNTTIRANDITNSYYDGIAIGDYGYGAPPAGTVINFNRIAGNNTSGSADTGGLWVDAGITDVDAQFNDWGDPSGPLLATNPGGLGDAIVGAADYSPWLGGFPSTPGSDLYVANATSDGADLSNALNNVMVAGDVLQLQGETYGGGVVVDNPAVTINLNGGTVGAGSPAFTINAADVTINGPGFIDGDPTDTAGNSTDPGILVNSGGDNFTLNGVDLSNWEDGVQLTGSVTSLKLVSNFIHDNSDAGLQIDSGVTVGGIVTVEGNLFKDNGGNGIQNDGATLLDATYNSWGDSGGPASGDGASANVTAIPFTYAEVYVDVVPATAGDDYIRGVTEYDTFDVAVKVDAENLFGINFALTYEADELTFNSMNAAVGFQGSAGCVTSHSVVGSVGTITYRCNRVLGDGEYDAVGGHVLDVNFTADGPALVGGATISSLLDVNHVEAATSAGAVGGVKVFVNNAGFNAPSVPDRDITDANDGELSITNTADYAGFIDLQGRVNDSGALLQVFDQAAKTGATLLASGFSTAGGGYTTALAGTLTLDFGVTYYLVADAALYLPTSATAGSQYLDSSTISGDPQPLATILLLGGDANDDDAVGLLDAVCIGADYGTAGSSCPSGSSDVNGDGAIDLLDLVLMGGNYGLDESPWTP